MAIDTVDKIVAGLAAGGQIVPFTKSGISNMVVSSWGTWFRSGTAPAAGSIPGAAAICNSATAGAIPFTNANAGLKTHIARASLVSAAANGHAQVCDRIAHMGGLSGTVTTAQAVGVDVATLSVPAARIGKTDYSELQWWLEWYTTTGSTGVTATINYVNGAGTAKSNTVSVPASTAAQRRIPIVPLAGDFIKGVTSVQLSATTGTAGSFGVSVTRPLANFELPIANMAYGFNWADCGLAVVPDDACLELQTLAAATTIGIVNGYLKLIQG